MTRTSGFVGVGGGVFSGWPEKVNRKIFALALVAVLIGTIVLSMTVLSIHRSEIVTVEPNSHFTIHLMAFGFCSMDFKHTESTYSYNAYIVEVDWKNYRLLVEGKEYDYMGYSAIGGGGGESSEGMAGFIWDMYIVVVNPDATPIIFNYEMDFSVFISYLPTVPMTALVIGYFYLLAKKRRGHSVSEAPEVEMGQVLTTPRKMLVIIAALTLFCPISVYVVGLFIPSSISAWVGIYVFHLIMLVAIVITFVLRMRLIVVPGEPKDVLNDLAHRFRVSRYMVEQKPKYISVQVSSTAAIKIRARSCPEGTLVSFQAGAMPAGWTIIVIPIFVLYGLPLAFALSLFTLYRVAAFARMRVVPRLSRLPIPSTQAAEINVKAVLIDSLSEGRRLASEAYDSVKSNYEDSLILSVLGAMLVFAGVALSATLLPSEILDGNQRIAFAIAAAAVVSVVFLAYAVRRLSAVSKLALAELKPWRERLGSALTRETTNAPAADSEPSSIEMVLDSYRELPKWLKARKKAGVFRQPGLWLLIFVCSYAVYQLTFMGVLFLVEGDPIGVWMLLAGAAFAGGAVALYLRWRSQQAVEAEGLSNEWDKRYESLKAEMEAFLRSV